MSALLLGLAASVACISCTEDVSLGAWASAGASAAAGSGGKSNAGGSSGAATGGANTCPRSGGVPGALNAPGPDPGVTITYTDFSWPAPIDSLEWDFQLENTVSKDGYFWAHEFDFVGANGGFLGLQHRGGYQADPPDGAPETENMMTFWIASATRAELGDVAYPAARTYLKVDSTPNWMTIHVLYDFQVCRSYRLRVGRHSTEANGDIWYGAWVRDNGTNVETYLGRILVPGAWGQIAPEKTDFFANRIGYAQVNDCDVAQPISALFGFPTANLGSVRPTSSRNRFASPAHCGNSRITDFPDAVRHELAVAP